MCFSRRLQAPQAVRQTESGKHLNLKNQERIAVSRSSPQILKEILLQACIARY